MTKVIITGIVAEEPNRTKSRRNYENQRWRQSKVKKWQSVREQRYINGKLIYISRALEKQNEKL